jgi:L-fuconolactonase
MFGSDWPVCLLEAEYNTVYAIIERYSSKLSVTEREKLFGLNASKFYKIPQVTI